MAEISGFLFFVYWAFGLGVAWAAFRDTDTPKNGDEAFAFLLIMAIVGMVWPCVIGYRAYMLMAAPPAVRDEGED